METSVEMAKIGPDGTVKLPDDIRKSAGFKSGSTIAIVRLNKGVMIGRANKRFLEATRRLHARKKKISQNEVEDLIQKVRYGNAS